MSQAPETFKACPFCGAYPHVEHDGPYFAVVCNTCGSRTDQYGSRQDAIELWNSRKEPLP